MAGGGKFSSSLDKIVVQGAGTSRELVHQIEENLESNQISIVAPEHATAIVNILSEETKKAVLTLDSDGKAREYELMLTVAFEVRRPDKSFLLSKQSITTSRDFVFDKSDFLGSNEEQQLIFSEMRSAAARLVFYRLQSITEQ